MVDEKNNKKSLEKILKVSSVKSKNNSKQDKLKSKNTKKSENQKLVNDVSKENESKKVKKSQITKTKKKNTKKRAVTMNVKAAGENRFFVCNKEIVSDLKEFANLLFTISENDFLYHVGENHNHFSDWLLNVLGHEELANNIKKITNSKDMQIVLLRYMLKLK